MNITEVTIIVDNPLLKEVELNPSNNTISFLSQILHSDFFLSEAEELEETMSWKNCPLTYKDLNKKVP